MSDNKPNSADNPITFTTKPTFPKHTDSHVQKRNSFTQYIFPVLIALFVIIAIISFKNYSDTRTILAGQIMKKDSSLSTREANALASIEMRRPFGITTYHHAI